MRRFGMIGRSLAAAAMVAGAVSSTALAAEGNPLAGRWVCRSDDLRVEMEFTEAGKCLATATSGQRTAKVEGKYKIGPDEVVLTPTTGEPITYHTLFKGEKLTLTGGDLGKLGLVLVRREVNVDAPAANHAAADAPPAIKLLADDKKVDEKKPDDKKPDEEKKPPVEGDVKLPGGKWVTQGLEKRAAIVKIRYDEVKNTVTFIVDLRENNYLSTVAKFYDEDGVQIAEAPLAPEGKDLRQRLTLTLPADAVLKKSVRVVVTPNN